MLFCFHKYRCFVTFQFQHLREINKTLVDKALCALYDFIDFYSRYMRLHFNRFNLPQFYLYFAATLMELSQYY